MMAIYFFLVHRKAMVARYLPAAKELMVALLFTSGCWGGPLFQHKIIQHPPYVWFFMLVSFWIILLNLLLFAFIERPVEQTNEIAYSTLTILLRLLMLGIVALLVYLFFAFPTPAVRWPAILFFLIELIHAIVYAVKWFHQNYRYRIVADGAFLLLFLGLLF